MRGLALVLTLLIGTAALGAEHGYQLYSDDHCSSWWTKGSFRVMHQSITSAERKLQMQLMI